MARKFQVRYPGKLSAFPYANFGRVDWDVARKHVAQFEVAIHREVHKRLNGTSQWITEVMPSKYVPGIEITLSRKANGTVNSRETMGQEDARHYAKIRPYEFREALSHLLALMEQIAPDNMQLMQLLPWCGARSPHLASELGSRLIFRVSIDDYTKFLSPEREKKKRNGRTS